MPFPESAITRFVYTSYLYVCSIYNLFPMHMALVYDCVVCTSMPDDHPQKSALGVLDKSPHSTVLKY